MGKKWKNFPRNAAESTVYITVLHEPRLLIFDEPFTGFDPVNANIIKNEILSLREKGATIIFSTHNMGSVEELCDDITLIDKGKAILNGSVDEIRNRWAGNEYDLVIEGKAAIEENEFFTVLSREYGENKSSYRLKSAPGTGPNEILKSAINSGRVISFNPALPSMNEIFIRVVAARN